MLDKESERAGDRLVGGRNLSLHWGLFFMSSLTTKPPLFLAFQLVIKEVESLLVCLGRTDDCEHALTGFVVGFLGNGDFRARKSTDLGNFSPVLADYAANHVRGDRDGLGPEVSLLRLLGGDGG